MSAQRHRRTALLALATALLASALFAALAFGAGSPIVSVTSISRVTETSARLAGTVNPNEREVKPLYFEYVDQTGFEANGFAGAAKTEAQTLPKGKEAVPVSAQIAGLVPNTTYHVRLFAHNSLGDSTGTERVFKAFVVPEPFGPCSNDAFRSGAPSGSLPDCRAYEQASPVDKNFGDIAGSVEQTRASVEGNRVSFAATSPIPGGEGATTFDPLYLGTRGPNGWSTQGMLPPQSEGGFSRVSSWTPDFSHVFAWARIASQPEVTTLLDRSTVAGSLQTIVPHTAGFDEPAVAGSSADGSAVFFEFRGSPPLTPEAADNKSNLYVWDRETDAYRLAGIFNDEKAPPGGSSGGSSGGAKGAYYTRDQHVAASDGSSVYFTVGGTGQLYLRENPTKQQSKLNGQGECIEADKACTIHVSASQKTNGTGPEGTDSAGPHPAAFLGASTDGSKAFFTSSEKLTNDANTGPEQPLAQIGRAKIGASEAEEEEPDLLPKHALGMATSPDGKYLYWVDPSSNTISRAKLNGSGKPTEIKDEYIVPGETSFETHPIVEPGVLNSAPSVIRHLAVDDEYVYWTNRGPLGDESNNGEILFENVLNGAGTIGRAKIGESKGEQIEPEFITGAFNPRGVAVNETSIYWVNAPNEVSRATLKGEKVNFSFFKAVGGQFPSGGVELDSNYVYFSLTSGPTEEGSSFISRVPLDGGKEEFVGFGSASKPRDLVINGPYIYLAAEATGTIGRTLITDFHEAFPHGCFEIPTCEAEFIKLEGAPFGLASDGERLYWSVNGEAPPNLGNDLYRYEVASGKLTDLAAHPEGTGAEVKGLLGASDEGSFVYFVASAALTEDAGPGGCHGNPQALTGVCNLYLSHEGQLSFIAPLNGASDHLDWNATADATKGFRPKQSRVSPDGKTLLFATTEKLTDYDNEGKRELYRYRFGDPDPVICVSCNPTGLPPSGIPRFGSVELPGFSSIGPTPVLTRNLSADGNRIFFESEEALLAADTNGEEGCPKLGEFGELSVIGACQDVYEWAAKGTGSCHTEAQNGGCLYLISTGKSSEVSYFLDASATGDDVFFFTRERLAPIDQDAFVDVYDARVGGGLASQNEPPPPVPCEGEACKGGASAPPEVGSPATPLFSGPGNQKPHRKKTKPRKKKHKHKRHAKAHGRAHR